MRFPLKAVGLIVGSGLIATAAAQAPPAGAVGQPDRAKLAHTLVNQCAAIAEGEQILITGGARDLDLLENIAIEVRKLGAHPLITLETEALARRMLTEVPPKFDAQERTFALRLAELVNVYIYVDSRERLDLLADIPVQRRTEADRAEFAFADALLKRNVRQLYLGNGLYPTPARAAQFGISEVELARIFWNGINVDYTQLQATAEKVQKRLADGREVKITAPNGTNLTVKIAQRLVFVSDGVISSKDRAQGGAACQAYLPAGEVYVTPVPGSANGTFIVENFFYEGKLIEGLKLEFKDGKLTTMTAKSDFTLLKQRYDAAPAGRDLFGYVDLGVNPNVEIPKDSRMVAWMAAGTIAIGVGANTWAGGDNNVPFEVYALLNGGTLTIDGKPVIEKGKLLVGRIE
jgi:leucyl aminopeptidase (aminopeptidase T)